MSIKVTGITKIYGEQKALDNVSFEVHEGEIVGLLGPNGAGKSTLMKILTCYIPPSSGNATVMGHDIFEEEMKVKESIGYLPESNPLYLDMYVKEYLKFVAGIFKIKNANAKVEEMISLTGLTKEQHKKIEALSKGYKQRVGLAQAFIHDPKVLILDEPTSGLDPNQLIEIRNLIKQIGKQKTVLFSSHIMQEVEAICDRVLIINNGKLVADSPTKDLQKLWQGKEVIIVEFKEDVEIAKLKKINGVASVEKQDRKFKIVASTRQDIRPLISDFVKDNKITLLGMQAEELSLEHVFQQLTKG